MIRFVLFFYALRSITIHAQIQDSARLNHLLDLKINLVGTVNFGRPIFELAAEYRLGSQVSTNTQLGFMTSSVSSIVSQKENITGWMVQQHVRYYLQPRSNYSGFYAGAGLAYRRCDFSVISNVGVGISQNDNYYNADYFKEMRLNYITHTAMFNLILGYKSIPDKRLFVDMNIGLGPRRAWVYNGLVDSEKYHVLDFNNPFFLYSYNGNRNYLGFTGNFSLGIRLFEKNKP
jgi:hypothetical protein